MKVTFQIKRKLAFAAVVLSVAIQLVEAAVPIRLNTVGFLPNQLKHASVADGGTVFSVVRTNDPAPVFTGRLSAPRKNADTGEILCEADFSAVRQTGIFQVDVPGVGRSAAFSIEPDVYNAPYVTAMRAFYFWRCGIAVRGEYEGKTFAHEACHTNDAWLDMATGQHTAKASRGGWHDAGDYNKYVVNAGMTVGTLLRAWEDFGIGLEKIPLHIPEAGKSTPEFLSEVKWELDWLLTMQDADGRVYGKVSTPAFGRFIKPEAETAPRYFSPWGTDSTANFTAVTAEAARIYLPYDPDFARACGQAAIKSYSLLKAHPAQQRETPAGFTTGNYDRNDKTARLWAAAEMWETFGDAGYLNDFEVRVRQNGEKINARWDYENPSLLGITTYLFSKRLGRDPSLVGTLSSNLVATADAVVCSAQAHGYARPCGTNYMWGGNGQVARQSIILHAANQIKPAPEYIQTTLDALGYLFGRNVHGRSYVTGLGYDPPQHPHDRRAASADVPGPWPGYLVGGPHPGAADWHDNQKDYRVNEVAINWNAALVYALASVVKTGN